MAKNPSKKTSILKAVLLGLFAVVLIVAGIFAFQVKQSLSDSFYQISRQIQILKNSIFEGKTGDMKNSLEAINQEIHGMENAANTFGITELFNIVGQFNKSLKAIPGAFKNISAISDRSSQIANDIDYLKNNALQLVFNQKGDELILRLDNIEKNLGDLENLNKDFKSQAVKIKDLNSRLASIYSIFDQNYLSIDLNIYKAKELVHSLNSILKSPEDTKILLLFQNPTEMRPAGGFIGSFGYVTLENGSIKEIKIDDIYNADRQLNVKVAPPTELSGITSQWGARDANWFFNFPDSAKKVSYFLENSKLFSGSQTEFKYVVAINTNVLKTLIETTGPIELPDYKLTINSDNFLSELQREVEAGQDKKPGQNPKKILSVLTPLWLEKLKNLDDDGKLTLIKNLKSASEQKDIMIFSEDDNLEKQMVEYGLAGETFDIPKNFNGDYLAIANSNVAGGKSDAFINQAVRLQSQIIEDGTIINNLSVSRTHTGQNEKDWWYRATNKDYTKIFVPLKSELAQIKGNDSSPYQLTAQAKNLLTDPDLGVIQKNSTYIKDLKIWNGEENGKVFFGAWINTSAGKTKTVQLEYKESRKVNIYDGAEFNFVFDKQSGNNGSLEYEVAAPPGYTWSESGKPTFNYGTQQVKARETIKLTLKKIF